MKKQKYIDELKANLKQVPPEVREEILSDINEHFAVGEAQGFSEEEISKNLGRPESIAAQVLEEYSDRKADSHSYEKVRGGYEINIDKSFSGVNNLDIDLCEADIRFVPSEDDEVRVQIKGRSRYNQYTVENDGGTLVVKSETPFFRFEIFRFRSKLNAEISVPAKFGGLIKANSTAGSVFSQNISGNLDFSTAAGNVTVEGHSGNRIALTTAAGNIEAELANDFAESIKITTAAGNAKLTAKEAGELKITSAAGNVRATLTKIGHTKLSSSAGNVKLTANEVAGDIRLSTAAGTATLYLPVDANIRIDVKKPSLGSLKNELAGNPQSPYTLKASSAVGSIKLLAL